MKIVAVRERVVPISSGMSNAVISFAAMTVSLVALVTDEWRNGRRVIGYGFNSNGRYAPTGILRDRMIPRLLSPDARLVDDDRAMLDPERAWITVMTNEKPGGHGDRSVAVGVLDMALWDIVGKLEGRPVAAVLADRYGTAPARGSVPVYAAGGYYYPGGTLDSLREEITRYLEMGYTSVKIKIGGAPLPEDLKRVEAVLTLLRDPADLAVDANGALSVDEAIAYAMALEPYGLRWFEEPGDPLDLLLHQRVAASTRTPLATGENLFSSMEVTNLLRYGGLRRDRDVLQMDPALASGVVEYVRMLEAVKNHGWNARSCIPHGGHQLNLACAAGLGLGGVESYPEHFAPFGGFSDEAPVVAGMASVSTAPGLGLEAKEGLYAVMKDLVSDL